MMNAAYGCQPMIQMLLERGSNVYPHSIEGYIALAGAEQMGHVTVVRMLVAEIAKRSRSQR